jgi:hypothetical protein
LNPNLDVCMTASLTCPRHKYACVMYSSSRLDRRADLAGRPSYGVHPTISMTRRSLIEPHKVVVVLVVVVLMVVHVLVVAVVPAGVAGPPFVRLKTQRTGD